MTSVLLIGLDGATFRVLDPLVAEGVMPALGRLMAESARSELLSTPNPFTPPAWTSLATGCGPGSHGIFDFVTVRHGTGRPTYGMATSRDVRRETIWSIASRHDRGVACLNFPLMFPPRPVNGYVVPGFLPPRHLRRNVHPPWLYERLRELPGFAEGELLLDMDLERESLQTLPEDRYEPWIELHIRREAQWARIAQMLLEEEQPDLLAVLFDGVDKLQHLCWSALDPELAPRRPTRFERRVQALCRRYFAELDRHVERLVEGVGEGANVVICSDHGFGPTSEIFYANVLLVRAGYLQWAAGASPDRSGRQMTEGHRNPTVLFDWERTSAYALTAGSNGIYVRDSNELRDAVAQTLLDFTDPRTGRRPVRQVLRREDAFPGDHSHLAPDLTVELRDHGFLSILNADEVVIPRAEVMGTHAPEGVLLARGPAIRPGGLVHAPRIEQIAPLVLYLLDLPIPADLEARLPTEPLDSGWLHRHPPARGAQSERPDAFFDRGRPALDAAGEAQVLDRLRALGYME